MAKFCFGALFFALISCLGAAQYVIPFSTVEAMAGQAQAIYLGEVSSVSSPTGPDKTFDVTLRVTEVLKGKPAITITLPSTTLVQVVDQVYTHEVYASWVQSKTRVLWFSFERGGKGDYVGWLKPQFRLGNGLYPEPAEVVWQPLRLDARAPEEKLARNPDPMKIFSLDFSVLDTPEKVLDATRSFVKKHPGLVAIGTMSIPTQITDLVEPRGGWALGGQVLFVPDVPEWRAVAKALIKNPQMLQGRTTIPGGIKREERDNYSRKLEAVLRDQLEETLKRMEAHR